MVATVLRNFRHLRGDMGGWHMPTANSPESIAHSDANAPAPVDESDLLAEILAAEADFARGDYIELTPEQLRRAIETGESPWPDESLG